MHRFIVRAIAIAMLFAVTFATVSTVVARAYIRREERRRTVPVAGAVPADFPVLVVYPGRKSPEARIVYHRDLRAFLCNLPRHSFRVAPEQVNRLNAYLTTRPSVEDIMLSQGPDCRFASGRFAVQDLGHGRQLLRVEGTWDDDRVNIGWYETDGRSITPLRRLTYFGPGLVLMALPCSAGITLGIWAVAIACLWMARRFARNNA